MRQEDHNHDELNCIEDKARELYGYDDESLLAEMEELESAMEAEKLEHPEEALRKEREAEESFLCFVEKLKAAEQENSETTADAMMPVTDGEMLTDDLPEVVSENQTETTTQDTDVPLKADRKILRFGKRRRKLFLLAAAIGVFGVGMSMVTVARREYKYNSYPLLQKQRGGELHNAAPLQRDSKLEEAYNQIESELNIKLLVLNDIPDGMEFEKIAVSDGGFSIRFLYDEKNVYFRQEKYHLDKANQKVRHSDRISYKTIYNEWLDCKIEIEVNELTDGTVEYSSYIILDDTSCYLEGVMSEKDFTRLVEGITYR